MTRTFNTRMVFRTMGALLLIESVFMTLALGVSLAKQIAMCFCSPLLLPYWPV